MANVTIYKTNKIYNIIHHCLSSSAIVLVAAINLAVEMFGDKTMPTVHLFS